jgi:Carboxypeptidase regulatory-like domain
MSSRTLLIASCALALFTGCSSPGVRPGSKVTGTVKYKGAPVAGAKVIFTDGKDGASPNGPTATTDEDGAYAVVGVPPGSYKVVVYKLVSKPGAKLPAEGEGMDLEQLEASGMGTHFLPKKYASPSSTTLLAQVQEGSHKEDFDLK